MNNVVYVVQLLSLNQIGAKGSPGPALLENSIRKLAVDFADCNLA